MIEILAPAPSFVLNSCYKAVFQDGLKNDKNKFLYENKKKLIGENPNQMPLYCLWRRS